MLQRAYGEEFCLAFSKDRCNQQMELDKDLFEDQEEFVEFIEIIQNYGVRNLALLKVWYTLKK